MLIATPCLLTWTATASAEDEWGKWRHDNLRRNWERVSVWPTAKECDSHLPRFAAFDLLHNRVPGWCCLPERLNPREAEGHDAALVWAYCAD